MKKRIIAVILAVTLGFCGFTVSLGRVAFASFLEVVQDFLSSLIDLNRAWEDLQDRYKYVFNNDKFEFEKRCTIVATFKPYTEDLSKDDFRYFIELFDDKDFDTIEEYFGILARETCEFNETEIERSILNILFTFGSVDDFLNYLYTPTHNFRFDDDGNVQIPVEDLKTELEKQNQTLTPKNRDVVKYSWRDLSDSQQYYNSNQLGRLIGRNHRFLDKVSYSDGVYIQYYGRVPGYAYQVPQEGIDDYYSPFQYHIYLETITEDGFTDSSGASYPHTKYEWHCDALYYLMIDGERSYHLDTVMTTFEDTMSGDTYRSAYKDFMYMNIGFMHSEYSARFVYCYPYNNAASAHKGLGTPFWDISSVSELFQFSPKKFLMSDDVLKNIDIGTFLYYSSRSGFFGSGISNKDVTANLTDFYTYHPDDDIFDYGFYASTEPFTTTYMFDITRLPSNSTVTISGDSVYDYSITDNSTGDTSTIYNYVTNNYAYPEKPDNNTSGGSGSGGGVSGNITVGGQVDVGGKVEIDVNINQQGGGLGTSYDMPDMSPIDGYLSEALEESSGVRLFLSEFFSFLPPQILVLLGIGLTVVILSRILGR